MGDMCMFMKVPKPFTSTLVKIDDSEQTLVDNSIYELLLVKGWYLEKEVLHFSLLSITGSTKHHCSKFKLDFKCF